MPKPLPWSHTSLETFVNCPRQYWAKYVGKTVQEPATQQMIWGREVHKHFEDRLAVNTPLPDVLHDHEPFMKRLEEKPGVLWTEQKIALNIKAAPCHFFAPDVWMRGVIDLKVVDSFGEGTGGRPSATVVDYKTGKPHNKEQQLALFAIHTFAQHPEIELVNTQYYWTTTCTTTKKIYERSDVPQLWAKILPNLKQYAQAFKDDLWQPRQSGLCNGWCPVKDCEFWKPKRAA